MLTTSNSIIGLDVGGRRIGVATANVVARLARPLTTLQNNDQIWTELQKVFTQEDAAVIVMGLPRNLSGQATDQTKVVELFAEQLKQHTAVPIFWQDEAVTSKKAEAELRARKKSYEKEEIDALAATYILEDFLREHPEVQA